MNHTRTYEFKYASVYYGVQQSYLDTSTVVICRCYGPYGTIWQLYIAGHELEGVAERNDRRTQEALALPNHALG